MRETATYQAIQHKKHLRTASCHFTQIAKGTNFLFHKMELRNDECLVHEERIALIHRVGTQSGLLRPTWPRRTCSFSGPRQHGLLKFPSFLSSLFRPNFPLLSGGWQQLLTPASAPVSLSCRSLWLSRLGNLFTWFVLTL